MWTTVTLRVRDPDPGEQDFVLQLVDGDEALLATEGIPASLKLADTDPDPEGFVPKVLETNAADPAFRKIGEHLYRLLTIGTVGTKYEELRKAGPVRTFLDIRPPKLSALPFEFLRDSEINKDLFARPAHPVVRVRGYAQPGKEARPWPLRALVVAASVDPAVAVTDEVERIREAVRPSNRTFDLEVLEHPTRQALQEALDLHRPHILHVIGHGYYDEDARESKLLFESNQGNFELGDGEIPTLFEDWQPFFVFLNTCRSATAADAATSWSLQTAFGNAGAKAVIGMQADIKGDRAGVLAAELYRHLARNEPLDVAMAHARKEVYKISATERDWAIPSLSLSCPPEIVFPMCPLACGAELEEIEVAKDFRGVKLFVDRLDVRRQLQRSMHPVTDEEKPKRVLIVHGKPEAGKTEAVRWCIEGCGRQDYQVRYVQIDDGESKSWLDVLRMVRDGDPSRAASSVLARPLDARAFDEFNWGLSARLQGKEPQEYKGEQVLDDHYSSAADLQNVGERFVPRTLDGFRKALESAASQRPLVLVLDDLSKGPTGLVPTDFANTLRPFLIEPIAVGDVKNVFMVLVVTDDERKKYGLEDDEIPRARSIPVDALPRGAFFELALDYVARKKNCKRADLEEIHPLVNHRIGKLPDPWLIKELKRFGEWLDQV